MGVQIWSAGGQHLGRLWCGNAFPSFPCLASSRLPSSSVSAIRNIPVAWLAARKWENRMLVFGPAVFGDEGTHVKGLFLKRPSFTAFWLCLMAWSLENLGMSEDEVLSSFLLRFVVWPKGGHVAHPCIDANSLLFTVLESHTSNSLPFSPFWTLANWCLMLLLESGHVLLLIPISAILEAQVGLS